MYVESETFFPHLLTIIKHYTIASYKLMCWQFHRGSREASNDATSVCQVEGPSSDHKHEIGHHG